MGGTAHASTDSLLIQGVFYAMEFRWLESALSLTSCGLEFDTLESDVHWRAGLAPARSFSVCRGPVTRKCLMDSIAKLLLAAIALGL